MLVHQQVQLGQDRDHADQEQRRFVQSFHSGMNLYQSPCVVFSGSCGGGWESHPPCEVLSTDNEISLSWQVQKNLFHALKEDFIKILQG